MKCENEMELFVREMTNFVSFLTIQTLDEAQFSE